MSVARGLINKEKIIKIWLICKWTCAYCVKIKLVYHIDCVKSELVSFGSENWNESFVVWIYETPCTKHWVFLNAFMKWVELISMILTISKHASLRMTSINVSRDMHNNSPMHIQNWNTPETKFVMHCIQYLHLWRMQCQRQLELTMTREEKEEKKCVSEQFMRDRLNVYNF